MTTQSTQSSLGRNSSALLDLVRFSAALAVLLSHITYFSTRFQWVPDYLGNQAVGVFFLLSGFIIRFVTAGRIGTLRDFFVDRASRIYSVVLPALVFTVAVEGCAYLAFPSGYLHFAGPDSWHLVLPRLLASVTFTDGFWGVGGTPLSNGALWSLTFEVVYYVLYGLMRYTRIARWFLVPLILLAAGPSIAGIFPIWLLGALLYDVYASLRKRTQALPLAAAAFAFVIALFALVRQPIRHLLAITDSTARLGFATRHTASSHFIQSLYPDGSAGWLSRLSPSFFFLGIAFAATLLPLMLLLDRLPAIIPSRLERAVRLVADSTFTLYCFHRPLLVLIFSVVGRKSTSWAFTTLVMAAVIAFSIALAIPLDRLKFQLRNRLRSPARRTIAPSYSHS